MTLDARKQLILQIEQLAFNTWPADATYHYSDWKIRVSDGITKRANSIWTSTGGVMTNHSSWMEDVQLFYRDKGLPVIVQISEVSPDGLDTQLEMRGFVKESESTVFIADTKQVIEHTRKAYEEHPFPFHLQGEHDETWLSQFMQAEMFESDKITFYDRLFTYIKPLKGFLTLYKDNQNAALGTSVVEEGWAGIINVVVHPTLRGQGVGRSLLHLLACWSAEQGANSMYLQVVDGNMPAIRLYESSGFIPLYKYHYRREPYVANK
ncbi:GNAT family N-acetyltransferase [Paenibacillus sp. RC67]|uniref:GNAT family N-acetyltransferase n=1 Tax=Paenibacillus sp. RC67 TaxID=3039392 RepID=UPI0024AE67E0|nr:GNAT family N-acetyltransferase [Paenibacillus sp. RC67]